MALPAPGQTINNASIYQLTTPTGALLYALQSTLGLGAIAYEVTPVASNTTATFGSDANGETITYNGQTSDITMVGAQQNGTSFSYNSNGSLYVLSNAPLNGLVTANLGVLGTVYVLPTDPLSTTPNQYIACYLTGTLILTDQGEVAVEALKIGDAIMTRSGAAKPVVWLGTRSYTGGSVQSNLRPIRIARDALAEGIPHRDLFVSPDHALFLDDVLIPARALINHTTITQPEADTFAYVHVELAEHDVLYAEGVAAETFIDDDSRHIFQNAADYKALYPDAPGRPAHYCAPRLDQGEVVQGVRDRIAARARELGVDSGALRGEFAHTQPDMLIGWAQNAAAPDTPVYLEVLADGVPATRIWADRSTAIAGQHGFAFTVPPLLRDRTLRVRRVADRAVLPLVQTAVSAAA